jgi:hypothetical protein
MTDSLDVRRHLLEDLALINEALTRNNALPDVTDTEAAAMTAADLAAAVAGSSRRLARIVETGSWQ